MTLDPQGRVLKREHKDVKAATHAEGDITVPLPEQPIAVGESWRHPNEVTATAKDGRLVKVKMEQKFTLEEVRTGVARIRMETQILTPIRDPAVEAQVVQCATTGEIRFDIEAGAPRKPADRRRPPRGRLPRRRQQHPLCHAVQRRTDGRRGESRRTPTVGCDKKSGIVAWTQSRRWVRLLVDLYATVVPLFAGTPLLAPRMVCRRWRPVVERGWYRLAGRSWCNI